MSNTHIPFDIKRPHIHLEFYITDLEGNSHTLDGILDTGAPRTEISSQFLIYSNILKLSDLPPARLGKSLQTEKIGKLVLPKVEICGQHILGLEAYISHFVEGWGVDALIGLDFFRKFKVGIDYSLGIIETEEFGKM